MIEDDDDEEEDDLSEDLALLMKKMRTLKNKFASKSKGKCFNYGSKNHFVRDCPKPKTFKSQDSSDEEEDPKAKQKKKRNFNKDKSKGKGKVQDYKKKLSRKILVGEWTSDTSSSSSDDEEVADLAMIKITLPRALPSPPTCLWSQANLERVRMRAAMTTMMRSSHVPSFGVCLSKPATSLSRNPKCWI
ncbi:hypothetical protein PR202_gb25952 [Eleusine coracana subsp. coracana]|uniref:CCHC-type domain-containing protein n=1 Tax=Eleusine coracana subsp. coracana TaxID=191504 RepID=A0AAV5FMP7_ELECO|nr:hypothetical protein PR202_gb25952 [Eleusine coracana subsp. coracana]